VNTIKPNCVKKRKIAENFFTIASCLAITTIFNINLLNSRRFSPRFEKWTDFAR